MLSVSESTIKRRLQLFDLSISNTYTVITDIDLDSKILNIMELFPNMGYKRMKGAI